MLYPWQVITRSMGLGLAGRLPFQLDPERLRSDLEAAQAYFKASPHKSVWLHNGGLQTIGLVTAGGDLTENRLIEGSTYEKTKAMACCPTIEEFLDGLGMQIRRVRLISLAPGSRIFWHYDPMNSMDGQADGHDGRVHVPIVTDPKVLFQISHQSYAWQPGEAWWGDFSFPHRVANRSGKTRVHLVLDVAIEDKFLKLMPDWFWEQREARISARRTAATLCRTWNIYRDYRPPALRRLKRRLIGSTFSRDKRAAG